MPCAANSSAHQARMNRPRSSLCGVGSTTHAPAIGALRELHEWRRGRGEKETRAAGMALLSARRTPQDDWDGGNVSAVGGAPDNFNLRLGKPPNLSAGLILNAARDLVVPWPVPTSLYPGNAPS